MVFDDTDVVLCVFQVKDLLWNSDSSVLAVWLEDMAVGDHKQGNTCSKFCAEEDKNLHVTIRHLIIAPLISLLLLQSSCGLWVTTTGT